MIASKAFRNALVSWVVSGLLLSSAWAADPTYGPKVYNKQGGDELVVASGGTVTVESGGAVVVGTTDITAELAALDGLDATELGVLNGVTAGTVTAGKAVVTTTNKHIDALVISDGGLALGAGAGTAITSTAAEINLLDGSVVANSIASKAALVDSEKKLQTNANNGTVEAGVTAVHYGDGLNVTAVLTLTNVVLTVGTSQNLGVGALLYTLPAGANLIRDAYMSVAIAGVSTTTDTPDVGLGTVVASGAIVTLDGTATFENIITGQTASDTNGTAAVKGAGPTAGNPLEITTGGAHTVYFNAADGWGANADAAGTLNGTVVLSYIRQAP